MTFIIILLVVLVFLFFLILNDTVKNNRNLRTRIIDMWGKLPDGNVNDEVMASISSWFENNSVNSKQMYIDSITWNDLDMDKVFKKVNNTLSTVGEEFLYNLLRCPTFMKSELEERSRLLNFFGKDSIARQKVQFIMAKLGKTRYINISDFFCSTDIVKYRKEKYYILLAFLLVISTILPFFNVKIGIAVLALIFLINVTVYYRTKNSIEHIFPVLGYIVQMINTADRIAKLDIPEIGSYQIKLKESVCKLKKVNKKAFNFLCKANNPIMEYAKSMLLLELIAFESSYNFLADNRDAIINIYEILGTLDSMIAIASYRECISLYCEPKLVESKYDVGMEVKAVNLYHPLIKNPVPYSFSFDKPILITGSNASGKSTFLKSIAINAIFAQTIFTCLAREFFSTRLMIYTSMALKDNLESKESYFITELKSLKRVIDAIGAGMPCLCIIDEVLRGTNTIERIAASSEVLYSLKNSNCMCIAATHDIELTAILEDVYEDYHFREEVTDDNDVVFNYYLYPGKSNTKNALKLLKVIGYDSSIIKRAQARSDKFVSDGIWGKVKTAQVD